MFGGLMAGTTPAGPQDATPGNKDETPDGEIPQWEEFPWHKYLVQDDIIKKWKDVDMKHIKYLHANFDIEQGKFVNIQLEKVSMVQTYS